MSDNNNRNNIDEEKTVISEEKMNEASSGKQAGSRNTTVSLFSKVNSVTIPSQLLDKVTKYSVQSKPREAIGLLGGKEQRSNELIILDIHFVSVGDETSVSFSEEDFKAFEEVLEEECYCVGWWHSHPGFGLFLSQTDINTHIYSFQLHNELSVALVVEPTMIDTNGRAAYKFYQVVGEEEKNPFEYKEIASYIQY